MALVVLLACALFAATWTAQVTNVPDDMKIVVAEPGDCWGSVYTQPVSEDEEIARFTALVGVDNTGYDAHGPANCKPQEGPYVINRFGYIEWEHDGSHHPCQDTDEETGGGTWRLPSSLIVRYSGTGVLIAILAQFRGRYEVQCTGPVIQSWNGGQLLGTYSDGAKTDSDLQTLAWGTPGWTDRLGYNASRTSQTSWDVNVPHAAGTEAPDFNARWSFMSSGDWAGTNQPCSQQGHSLHQVTAVLDGKYDCVLGVPSWDPS